MADKAKRLLSKTCRSCKKKTDTLEVVHEIVDRFEVKEVKACPKCAKRIKKENSQFSNY